MVIGALISAVFFFAYTQVRNNAQNLGFSCAVNFVLNIYYATLYAYTPEVQPTAHRGTANGIALSFNRIMGILSAVVATEADVRPNEHPPAFLLAHLHFLLDFILRSAVDLQRAVHWDGGCCSCLPVRAIW